MKHRTAVKRIVCNYLGISPFDCGFGIDVCLFEEEIDYLEYEIFLYLRRHKSASKEIGHGMFGSSNEELHRLALAYLIKFGLIIENE